MTDSTLGEILFLIRAEFLEIPRLQLTQSQIEHLWGIDAAIAGAILSSLVEAHFLMKTQAGRYTRRACSSLVATQPSRFPGMRQGDSAER